MFRHYHYSCQGESHKATNKVCQDFSLSSISKNGLAIAIVCDGHGGDRYFRSDVGAKYAAEITKQCVTTFVENVDKGLFVGKPFTSEGCFDSDTGRKQSAIDKALRQLFSSIIFQWNTKITSHAGSTPISEWERENVEAKYLDALVNGLSLEKIYGCTLMAYVQTPDYWFAFHLGDGKCVSFNEDPIWQEPIPWDDRCFLNKTTSLCDSNAINEFRYCYEGDGSYPIAIFLASDGLDDSFGEITNQVNFYIQVLKMLVTDGKKATEDSIIETLPQLSKIGSKDDMSIAFIYDEKRLKNYMLQLINYQIDLVKDELNILSSRVATLKDTLNNLPKDKQIEINYAEKDIEKAEQARVKQLLKYDILMQQLSLAFQNSCDK